MAHFGPRNGPKSNKIKKNSKIRLFSEKLKERNCKKVLREYSKFFLDILDNFCELHLSEHFSNEKNASFQNTKENTLKYDWSILSQKNWTRKCSDRCSLQNFSKKIFFFDYSLNTFLKLLCCSFLISLLIVFKFQFFHHTVKFPLRI